MFQFPEGLASQSASASSMPPSNLMQLPCSNRRWAMRQKVRMSSDKGLSYKEAGVDIDAGNELVRRIQKLNPSIGGFSGMVPFGEQSLP